VLEKLCERESALGELRRLAQAFLCLFRKGHTDGLNHLWRKAISRTFKPSHGRFSATRMRSPRPSSYLGAMGRPRAS
jgi:hypothetical protein